MPTPPELTEQDRQQVDKLLSSPIFFPEEFKTWLVDFFATNVPKIPFHQFLGAKLNIAKSGGFVATQEGTTSTTYTDLTTPGPTIAGLANGQYAILGGAGIVTTDEAAFSFEINGAAASDNDSQESRWNSSASRGLLKTLKSNNNNSVKLKYRSVTGGLTKNFKNRWLAVIRIGTG